MLPTASGAKTKFATAKHTENGRKSELYRLIPSNNETIAAELQLMTCEKREVAGNFSTLAGYQIPPVPFMKTCGQQSRQR